MSNCKICKGTKKILLLFNEVDCECVEKKSEEETSNKKWYWRADVNKKNNLYYVPIGNTFLLQLNPITFGAINKQRHKIFAYVKYENCDMAKTHFKTNELDKAKKWVEKELHNKLNNNKEEESKK